MYHVHQDARTMRSSKKIAEALTALLRTTSINKVTITAVCAKARVARTTFYRSFDRISDVVKWHLCVKMAVAAERLPRPRPDVNQSLAVRMAASRVLKESQTISSLLCDDRTDILESAFATVANNYAYKFSSNAPKGGSELRRFVRTRSAFVGMMAMLREDEHVGVNPYEWLDALVSGLVSGLASDLGSDLGPGSPNDPSGAARVCASAAPR